MRLLLVMCVWMAATASAWSADTSTPPQQWTERLGRLAIQDGGRVMPLESYARRLAVQLTGRTRWSAEDGPEGFTRREPMELLCALMFGGEKAVHTRVIAIENRPFKSAVGLEAERRFFSAADIAGNAKINDLLMTYMRAKQSDAQLKPTRDQRIALDLRNAAERVAGLATGERLAIAPGAPGTPFAKVGVASGDPGTEPVQSALAAFGKAYAAGSGLESAAEDVARAVERAGTLDAAAARSVRLEYFYERHRPWRKTAVAYGLALVLLGFSRLTLRTPLLVAALAAGVWGLCEHVLGIGLRVAILGRAPVSNTYEALLWMGLIAVGTGAIAQIVNRKAWYLAAGLGAALASVLFAGLVPLEDRTNALPAVLRSNYWLILHVLTVVASYGAFAVGAVLGHVYLVKHVLLRRARTGGGVSDPRASHPLIVQTYRTIQLGLVLLTAGTILGGVWAADSWGRFWGWDPKETWALISIVVYFTLLHARYVRWIRDFGLAASSILGFVVIVWTFYGVNYIMGTGLHSYGFGSGGVVWVGAWAGAEIVFLVLCRLRRRPEAMPDVPGTAARPHAGVTA